LRNGTEANKDSEEIEVTKEEISDEMKGGGGRTGPVISLGGGGGGGGGNHGPGGHGGSVQGVVVATAGSSGNNGFYTCNGDDIVLYGNVFSISREQGGPLIPLTTKIEQSPKSELVKKILK
jgi:hypothetical protein